MLNQTYTGERGYLLYQDQNSSAGLNHWQNNLKALIREAVYLNRIAVITSPRLAAIHNFGYALEPIWSTYLNLAETTVYRHSGGQKQKIAPPLQYVLAEDFNLLDFRPLERLDIQNDQEIRQADNKRYRLVIRNVSQIKSGLWRYATPHLNQEMTIQCFPAEAVLDIAKPIVQHLDTYIAIHIRRGDRLRLQTHLDRDTSPPNVLRVLSQIQATQTDKLYILTDEGERHFFDPLRDHYQVYQYFDFPALSSLIKGESPDNYKLYMVEKYILAQAAIKIHTFKEDGGDYTLSRYYRHQRSCRVHWQRFYQRWERRFKKIYAKL